MHTLSIPATVESLDSLTDFVADVAAEGGLPSEARNRLRLAAEEVFTNIVLHGYRGAPEGADEAAVTVEGGPQAESGAWVRFRDRAIPFDPTLVPDPVDLSYPIAERSAGGLGVYLIRLTTDEFTYQRINGQNVVTITLSRDPADIPSSRT